MAADGDSSVLPIDAAQTRAAPHFAVCTLVNDRAQYQAMLASFITGGFTRDTTEYLFLDNTQTPAWDAYRGIPKLLAASRARTIILCHQDIRLIDEGAADLTVRLAELDARDPHWAIAGNAGGLPCGGIARRISDPHGDNQRVGALPAPAVSLDENFLILRRDAPIGLSADLAGFHFYGTDLCLQARLAGRSAWVIDFHLRHLSPGRTDASFREAKSMMEAKYAALFAQPWNLRTTCTKLRLRRNALSRWWSARRRR